MTPTTFKKYLQQAQDLETRTQLPTIETDRGLDHLSNAYEKTIRGVVSKHGTRDHQYKIELRYEPKETVTSGNEKYINGGYWVCRLIKTVCSSYNILWKGKEMNQIKSAELCEWFKFNTTEELLKRTENCVKFLEGFKLQHDNKTVLTED